MVLARQVTGYACPQCATLWPTNMGAFDCCHSWVVSKPAYGCDHCGLIFEDVESADACCQSLDVVYVIIRDSER